MTEFFNSIVAFEKEINLLTVALRIVLAVIVGGIIGLERGRHGSQAGMRTHILVCLGGALTSLLGVYCTQILGYDSDPLRISAQVVSGIGFLGAGMIIVKSDKMITGLTTAAIMWTTAIIGVAVGVGFYSGALIAMLACVFTAAFLTRLERKRKKATCIYIEIDDLHSLGRITDDIKTLIPDDSHVELVSAKSGMAGHLGVLVITSMLKDVDSVKSSVSALNGVYFVIVE
ncbi:MAG: MgtC/SapB family protein [Clostridia bacterium]|nr:MgtC/SapB family protein [Clostridia bacterium]